MAAFQLDDLILDDVLAALGEVPHDPELHVVLRPGHPPNPALVEIGKVIEVHIGLVKNDDFAFEDRGTDLAGAFVVMLTGGVHDGERWKKAVQVEPQVHLCGRLAPAVLRPVHAIGHQLDDGRIHRVDSDLEAPQRARALAACGKIRTGVLKMAQHGPEDPFSKFRIALLVCMGEAVLGWRGDAKARQHGRLETKPVTHIIKPHCVRELGEEHRGEVA